MIGHYGVPAPVISLWCFLSIHSLDSDVCQSGREELFPSLVERSSISFHNLQTKFFCIILYVCMDGKLEKDSTWKSKPMRHFMRCTGKIWTQFLHKKVNLFWWAHFEMVKMRGNFSHFRILWQNRMQLPKSWPIIPTNQFWVSTNQIKL